MRQDTQSILKAADQFHTARRIINTNISDTAMEREKFGVAGFHPPAPAAPSQRSDSMIFRTVSRFWYSPMIMHMLVETRT